MSLQKIHRRKNQQIPKEFICTEEGCGKAYGSSPALYTHIKTKHGSSIIIVNPKQSEPKTGKKGRPISKLKETPIESQIINEHACKLCNQDQCLCDSSMNYQQVEQTINVMSDRNFLRLLHCIGGLSTGQTFTWIRSSQDQYIIYTKQELNDLIVKVKPKVKVDAVWQNYLIHLSKFIDPKYIKELFQFILLIMTKSFQNESELDEYPEEQFKNIRKCRDKKKKEWAQFIEFLTNI